jgi:hypothetical protein
MEKKVKGLEEFCDRGRFTSREAYLDKNPDAVLHSQCTDVVQYVDGHIIQVLQSGLFMVDERFSSRSLDEAEVQLYRNNISK